MIGKVGEKLSFRVQCKPHRHVVSPISGEGLLSEKMCHHQSLPKKSQIPLAELGHCGFRVFRNNWLLTDNTMNMLSAVDI